MCSYDSMNYIGPTGYMATDEDDLILCKALDQKSFSSGRIIIRSLKEKQMQILKTDTLVSSFGGFSLGLFLLIYFIYIR